VIEDPHERTRAVLWLLSDLDPDMPVIQALGYLKAVEAQLEAWDAKAQRQQRYAGPGGVEALAEDLRSKPAALAFARAGQMDKLVKLVKDWAGVSTHRAHGAADMLREWAESDEAI